MSGITPNQGTTSNPVPPLTGTEEATAEGKKTEEEQVNKGFSEENTFGYKESSDLNTAKTGSSIADQPDLDTDIPFKPATPQELQNNAASVKREQVISFLNSWPNSQGIDPELTNLAIENINSISTLEPGSKDPRFAIVNTHVEMISELFTSEDGRLTKGKLEEILQSLNTKMADNQSQRAQDEIKANAKEKAALREQLLDKLEERMKIRSEHTVTRKVCFKTRMGLSKTGAQKMNKVNAEIAQITGKLSGNPQISTMFAAVLNRPRLLGHPLVRALLAPMMEKLAELGLNMKIFSPRGAGGKEAISDARHQLVEGIGITQDSVNQAQFMKLLQKLAQANENNEKLEEAIAALQGGDPKAAAEALKGMTDLLDPTPSRTQQVAHIMHGISKGELTEFRELVSYFEQPDVSLENLENEAQSELDENLQEVADSAEDQLDLDMGDYQSKSYG